MTTQACPVPFAGDAGQAHAVSEGGQVGEGEQVKQVEQVAGVEEVAGPAGDLDALLAETAVVLAEFGADWCPPCRAMAPALRQLAGEYAGRARVVSVDTERYPAMVDRYGVLGLPTVVVFREGREVTRLLGLRSIGALRQVLEGALAAPTGGARRSGRAGA
jgi:thioredoxin 1